METDYDNNEVGKILRSYNIIPFRTTSVMGIEGAVKDIVRWKDEQLNAAHQKMNAVNHHDALAASIMESKIYRRDWTIELDEDRDEFIAFPTEQGIQHDYDQGSDGMRYCGNCLWSKDIDTLHDAIDEKIIVTQDFQIDKLREALHRSTAALRGVKDAIDQIVVFPELDKILKSNDQLLNS